ncbi:hypothetical protein CR513_33563, partial [Mucuna pruriens]
MLMTLTLVGKWHHGFESISKGTIMVETKKGLTQEIAQVKMEKRDRYFPISFKYTTNIVMKVKVND